MGLTNVNLYSKTCIFSEGTTLQLPENVSVEKQPESEFYPGINRWKLWTGNKKSQGIGVRDGTTRDVIITVIAIILGDAKPAPSENS